MGEGGKERKARRCRRSTPPRAEGRSSTLQLAAATAPTQRPRSADRAAEGGRQARGAPVKKEGGGGAGRTRAAPRRAARARSPFDVVRPRCARGKSGFAPARSRGSGGGAPKTVRRGRSAGAAPHGRAVGTAEARSGCRRHDPSSPRRPHQPPPVRSSGWPRLTRHAGATLALATSLGCASPAAGLAWLAPWRRRAESSCPSASRAEPPRAPGPGASCHPGRAGAWARMGATRRRFRHPARRARRAWGSSSAPMAPFAFKVLLPASVWLTTRAGRTRTSRVAAACPQSSRRRCGRDLLAGERAEAPHGGAARPWAWTRAVWGSVRRPASSRTRARARCEGLRGPGRVSAGTQVKGGGFHGSS
ncbi:hypothetical protein PVAP13_2KG582818 [Panicum virgatum]|uniref:Uncharacterized protein n=1 Tax=Panicum virgatum TaxID=38727 RepID=A0A8T0WIW7_PANVG|nr:hypothetical protein PVAP13_2KG582818 [Panicum virgatum]